MWFAIDYPERTNGLILLSSAVPGPEPDAIPKLVREHDLVYWSAIKVRPGHADRASAAEGSPRKVD